VHLLRRHDRPVRRIHHNEGSTSAADEDAHMRARRRGETNEGLLGGAETNIDRPPTFARQRPGRMTGNEHVETVTHSAHVLRLSGPAAPTSAIHRYVDRAGRRHVTHI